MMGNGNDGSDVGAMGAKEMMGAPGVPDEMGVPCGCGYF